MINDIIANDSILSSLTALIIFLGAVSFLMGISGHD